MSQGQTLWSMSVEGLAAVIPIEWPEIEALGLGRLEGGGRDARITGIKADSREVGPGDLFVALNTGVEHVGCCSGARRRHARPRRPGSRAGSARHPRALEERCASRRRGGIGGQDLDEGHPGSALRSAHSDDLGGQEPQQRDRAPAHRVRGWSPRRRSSSPRWACAGSGRSLRSALSLGPTSPSSRTSALSTWSCSEPWRRSPRRTPR